MQKVESRFYFCTILNNVLQKVTILLLTTYNFTSQLKNLEKLWSYIVYLYIM